ILLFDLLNIICTRVASLDIQICVPYKMIISLVLEQLSWGFQPQRAWFGSLTVGVLADFLSLWDALENTECHVGDGGGQDFFPHGAYSRSAMLSCTLKKKICFCNFFVQQAYTDIYMKDIHGREVVYIGLFFPSVVHHIVSFLNPDNSSHYLSGRRI
ncbi:hypothetical protein ACJX0J_030923, partial [Zea mays]